MIFLTTSFDKADYQLKILNGKVIEGIIIFDLYECLSSILEKVLILANNFKII